MRQNRFGFRHLLSVMLAIVLCVQTAVPVYAMDSNLLNSSIGDVTVEGADGMSLLNEENPEDPESDDDEAVSKEAASSELSDVISGSETGDETGYSGEGAESGSDNPADDQDGKENADPDSDSEENEITDAPEASEEELVEDEEAAQEDETEVPVSEEKEEKLLKETNSGTCGKGDDAENVTWSYDTETNILTIDGTGAMADYNSSDSSPYSQYAKSGATKIIIEEGVTAIGENAFRDYSNVTAVEIQEGSILTSIGNSAFRGCTKCESFNFPQSITTIGSNSFDSCHKLTAFTAPQSLLSIGQEAFRYCGGLTSVDLSTASVVLNTNSFSYCPKLTTVILPNAIESIPNNCFDNCTTLATINVPDSVTTIGSRAFAYCKALTSCPLPANLTFIGSEAFYGCIGITEAAIPAGVTTIKERAFRECTGLTTVVIPAAATSLESNIFYGCSSLSSVTLQQTTAVSIPNSMFENCSALKQIALPATTTSIGNYAFKGSGLTSIVIPDSVTSIGTEVLSSCTDLTSVTLPENYAAAIPNNAFDGCTKLTTVTIPANVTSIGSQVFKDSGLTSIVIPAKVTKINTYAFERCYGLKTVTFAENSVITEISANAFRDCTNEAFTQITIPKSVTNLYKDAFPGCTHLAAIYIEEGSATYYHTNGVVYKKSDNLLHIIPPAYTGEIRPLKGITELTTDYYKGNTTVTTAYVPCTVVTIKQEAFRGCTNLKQIIFEKDDNGETALTTIESSAFRGCSSLTGIDIPETVTILGESIFEDCTGLTAVDLSDLTLANGKTKVPSYIFKNCSALTTVKLPANATQIGQQAFYGCSLLSGVTVPNTVTAIDYNSFEKCSSLTSFAFPAGVTKISNGTFQDCSALATVTVHDGITEIGSNAFKNCSLLTGFQIPSAVTKIDYNAFDNCQKLTSVSIPATCTTLGSSVFARCSGLETATLAEGCQITKIQGSTFESCSSLKNVNIPATVTEINGSAFKNCTSLAAIALPSGLTRIDGEAFRSCTSLNNIVIPDGVTNLAQNSFGDCSGLSKLRFTTDGKDGGNANYYSSNDIIYRKSDNSVYIKPAGWDGEYDLSGIEVLTKDYYKGNTKKTSITIPKNIKTIGDQAFMGCTGLVTVTFESGSALTAINSEAFRDCTSLKNIVLPSGVLTIGNNAFRNCTALTTFTIPNAVTNVGENAFYSCTALTTLTIGDHVETFGGSACYGCTALTKVTIPASVTSLGSYAFSGCTSLATVTFAGTSQLTNILYGTFENTVITKFNIPASVTSFSTSAFYGCSKLATMTVDSGNPTYYAQSGIVYLKSNDTVYFKPAANGSNPVVIITKYTAADYAKEKNPASVTIPKTVTSIEARAFYNADKLTTVKFASGSKLTTIGDNAFYDCDKLKSISLPMSVTSIGDSAFEDCDILATCNLPAKLGTIGTEAFYDCPKLSAVKFPATLTTIGTRAYQYCTSLKTVTVPATVTSIGDYAFASCTNMTTAIINFPNNSGMGNNIFYNCKALTTATLNSKIIGSEMFDQCVKLKTLKMTGVEVIEYCAFNGCTLLTSITLPTTVKTIKANAFSSSSFRTINLNDGLETIGDNAFSGCTYLQELKIPEGITVIPSGAFANCVFLTKLYIPSTVTDINLSAFNQCKSLAEIIIDKNNPKYVVVDGVVYTIEDDESRTFFYCPLAWDESERLTVPEGSTSIPAGAFKNNQTIVNVTIPATVTSIGASAFEGCARLRSVTFEEGSVLTSIGDKAFYKCGDLNRLTFTGDTVLQSIGSQAFYSCSDLTGLYFENNTKDISIGNNAFNGATKFTGFFNGSDQANLGNIGTDAFWNCTALEYVRLGQSVSSLARIHYSGYEYNPFYGCTSLKAFEMEGDSNDYCYVNDGVLFLKSYTTNTTTDSAQDLQNVLYCYPYAREAYTYTVPDGTQGIGESAFRYNNTLEEIIFAESVSVIDDFAFDDCARLSKIDGMKMQYINRYAFSDCVRLEEADLSQTTEKTLQSDVFYRCTSLKKAVLPSTVTKVAPYAFYNCYNLTDLNLSDEITFVGSRAFYGCYKWQQAKVPAAISGAIGDYAFYNCDYIESINIPAGVTSIGERAFADLRSLSSLTFEEGISLTSIGECAFMSAPNIKKVVIPEGVTTLGGGVFLSCTALEEVSLPSSLTTMSGSYRLTTDNEYAYGNYARYGSYIFARDKALRRIVINNPKLSVPKYMFFDSGTTPTIYIYSADSEEEGSVKNWASSYSEGCFNPVWVDITKYDTELDPYYSGGSTVEIPVSGHFTVVMDNHENEFTWDYNKDTKTVTIDGTGILSVEYLKNYDNEDDDIILGLFGEGEEEPDTLWSAYYRDEVEHVILSDRITGLGPFTFMNHTALKYVDYGTLTLIGYEAFYGCRALTEFDFKSGLKEIGYEAFYNCNALESVVLPESLETMGNYVFESCHNLKTAEFLGTAQTPSSLKMLPYGSFSNCEKLERLTIGEGVETLTSIYGCTGLTTLNLPVSLTELDLNLEDLTALTTITVTEGSEHFKVIEGCLYGYIDGSWSFIWGRMERETDQGKVLYISENMTGINFPSLALKKNYARVIVEEGNSQYMEVDNAVYSKDGKTLYLVPSLAEGEDGVFNIAPGTKTIGTYAFSNCSRLTTVNIPDSVSDIQSYAFSGSSIRGTITIPQSVTSISNYAFAYARKVSYFILPSSLTNIGYNAFYYCEALKEINIPDSVVSMGSYAFGYCSSLKKANVSGSVGSIPGSCFYNCSKLDDVRLGEGITVMYGNAFGYCSSLVEILLPEGMKRLEGQTFNYCSSLEKVTIPASVDYIYNRTDWYKQGTTYYNVANAFYGTTEDMVIYGESGTTAEEFAECAIASWPKSSGAGCYVREGIYFSERSSDKFYITYMLDQLKGEYNHPDNPTSYRTLDNIIVLKDASKAGYTFDGWYTDRELTKKITEVVASFEARQLTLYPKFLENHTATIKAEGLPDRIETVPDTRSFKDQGITGTEIEGKQFVGFVNANDSSFDPEAPVYGDVTVTAVYTGDDSVAVKAPLASLKSGDIVVGSAISLKTETEDADIYYSFGDAALVNGSSIAADATKYGDRIIAEAELFEAGTLVLNAVAVKGDVISKKAVYEYRIADTTAFWGEVAPVDRAAFGSADEVPKGIWVAEVPERNPYTGSKITFDVRVYYGKLLLTEKTDYTLTYKNNVNVYTVKEGEDGFDPKKAPTITIKGKGNYKESRVVYFCINPVYLSSAMLQTKVTMYSNWDPELQKYAYPDAPDYDTSITLFDRVIASGKAQKLAPVVKADKVTLKAGKDYDVIYDDGNPDYKAPGCYYLTLKGKGNYAGEIMAGYVISEKTISPISKAKITGLQSKVPYSGQEITQKLKLTYTVNKKPVDLVSGTDYTISYENNISVGTASVIIRGRGSYAGQVIKTFKITGTPITKAKVKDLTASMSYDGKPKYQKNAYLEIPANKKNKTEAVVLKRGKDYTISYLNNVKAGTASVIFTGIGAYTGKIKKTFKITALETKTDQLRKHPNLIVKVSDAPYAKGGVKPPVSVTYKGLELTNGKDYTVSFKNNKKVYKLTEADEGFIAKQAPTATIKFKGSYKGSIVQYFCITEQSFELMSVTAQDLVFADKPGNFKNKVLIKDLDGKALKAGTDYDQNLVYTYAEKCGSKNAGAVIADTDTVPVGAVVKVTALAKASGSYTGSASAIYRIAQESIAKASIAVSKDAAFVYTGSGLVPRKTDITVKVGSTELAPSDYDIVSCTNNVKTGKGTITIKGKGPGYCGTKSATFQIAQKSLKMVAEVPETP